MADELQGAGITAKERLERIEALLDRMDRKLDSKVDTQEFLALDARVRDIELHGSQHVQDLLAGAGKMTESVTSLTDGQNAIKVRVAYAAGAAAVAVIVAEIIIGKILG